MKRENKRTRASYLRSRLLSVLALLFLVSSFSGDAVAQHAGSDTRITVRITDPQGAIVIKAAITLYTRDHGFVIKGLTDEKGTFVFEHLEPGDYLIEAEAIGFARAPAQALHVERNAAATLDISLPLAGITEQVVVTAQGTAQTVDEVSKAVSVLDQQQMDERDEATIPEALRVVPGLRVQQLGGPGSFTSIKTRGLRNEDTAILIDGLRLRDAGAPQGDASGFLEDLIVTDVSRVEVLRGSGSSLYGSNAIGGVVNLVTDEGAGLFTVVCLAKVGDWGCFGAGLGWPVVPATTASSIARGSQN